MIKGFKYLALMALLFLFIYAIPWWLNNRASATLIFIDSTITDHGTIIHSPRNGRMSGVWIVRSDGQTDADLGIVKMHLFISISQAGSPLQIHEMSSGVEGGTLAVGTFGLRSLDPITINWKFDSVSPRNKCVLYIATYTEDENRSLVRILVVVSRVLGITLALIALIVQILAQRKMKERRQGG